MENPRVTRVQRLFDAASPSVSVGPTAGAAIAADVGVVLAVGALAGATAAGWAAGRSLRNALAKNAGLDGRGCVTTGAAMTAAGTEGEACGKTSESADGVGVGAGV